MDTKFARFVTPMLVTVLTLALVTPVASGTDTGATGAATGSALITGERDGTESLSLPHRQADTNQDEYLIPNDQTTIYLPLVEYELDKATERAALVALYNSMAGEMWYDSTGWGTNAPHCTWYGVMCDWNGHVATLYLGQNNLQGSPPAEIGNLANLRELYLRWNQLNSLPPEIGNLANLRVLDLAVNQLTYLPPEIGNLAELREIHLATNPLTSLPPEIYNLRNLEVLDLFNIGLLLTIPPEIGNLTNLRELSLDFSTVSSLPAEIGKLTNLQFLAMGYCSLTSLPPEIGNLTNLQLLGFYANYLTSLPPEIGNLVNMQQLSLAYNRLSDPIPAWLSNMVHMEFLDLSGNPDLTCWETRQARDWALLLDYYTGPTEVCDD